MPDFTTYDWAQLFPGTSPSARLGHAMVWDGTRVILFGGNTSAFSVARSAETWEYAGGTWTLLSPATSPPARAFHRMVWDGSRILMFGGSGQSPSFPFLDDLWEFSGGTWTQLFPANSPSTRCWHDMVWDGSRVLLYGGTHLAGSVPDGETWEYTAGDWNQLAPANSPQNVPGGSPGPVGRLRHRMVWDGTQVVLLGGISNSNVYTTIPEYESGGNTWVFDGTDWSQPGPVAQPGERYSHAICVTDDDNKTLIFSGNISTTGTVGENVVRELWIYNGTTWVEQGESIDPGARLDSDMVWDGERVILFGGNFYTSATVHDVDAETWEYAGPPTPPPPPTPIAASISHIFGAN